MASRGTPSSRGESGMKHWAGSRNVIGRKISEVSPAFREMRPESFERVIRVAVTGQAERFETYLHFIEEMAFHFRVLSA
jgi:hypothetical protein